MSKTYTGKYHIGEEVLVLETKWTIAKITACFGTAATLDYRLEATGPGSNWDIRDCLETDLRRQGEAPSGLRDIDQARELLIEVGQYITKKEDVRNLSFQTKGKKLYSKILEFLNRTNP